VVAHDCDYALAPEGSIGSLRRPGLGQDLVAVIGHPGQTVGMVARIRHITVDCQDAYRLAEFWSALTGWPIEPQNEPGDTECLVAPVSPEPVDTPTPGLLFIQVPDGTCCQPATGGRLPA
jgi:hypothetical protein